MRYKHLKYDVRTGLKRIKTKTFVAITTLGLILGGGGLSLAVYGTASATTPFWNVSGSYQINVEYQSINYPETLNLTQSGATITGGDLNTIPPAAASAFTVTSGSVSGNNIDIFAKQDTTTLVVHLFGTIAPAGSMSGNWGDISPGTRTGTWATTSGTAVSAKNPKLDWKSNLQCTDKVGAPVVNVTQKVKNDADSGTAGNTWALDNYNRHIQVWTTSATGTDPTEIYYCATVAYDGSFKTFAGSSPQNATTSGTVGAGVTGDFEGGYLSTHFTGTLLGIPTQPTHGNIGTFDYNCNSSGACLGNLPSWRDFYFSSTSGFDLAWWGWQYDTCQNGNWINSIDGNFGDITGNAPSHQGKERCHEDNDKHHHDNDGDHGHHHNDSHHDRDEHHGPRE